MKRFLLLVGMICVCAVTSHAQTQIAGFAVDPPTCDNTRGLMIYNTTTLILKSCGPTANTWSALGGGGGGTISGSIAAPQIAFGTAANTIGGDANLLWDNTNKVQTLGPPNASFSAFAQTLLVPSANTGFFDSRGIGGATYHTTASAFLQSAGNSGVPEQAFLGTFDLENAGAATATKAGGIFLSYLKGAGTVTDAIGLGVQPVTGASIGNVATISGVRTVLGFAHNSPTVVTNGIAFDAQPSNSGTGTVTNLTGFRAKAPTGGGTTTNTYGFYSENQGNTANHYDYYSAGGNNYFGPVISTFSAAMQGVLTNNPGGISQFATMDPTSPLLSNVVVATQSNNGTNAQEVNFFGYMEQDGSTNLVNKIRNASEFTMGYNSTGNADSNTQLWGVGGSFQHGAVSTVNTGIGVEAQIEELTSGATLTNGIGVESRVETSAGSTMTNGYFFKATPWTHSGTSTNLYDYYAGTTAGFATNNYGLFTEDFGSNANDYAIYVTGGKSHLAGPVDTLGPVTVTSDGVHNGIVSMTCNTTDAALPANTVSILGCPAASNTAWGIRLPTSEPGALSVPTLATASSHYSQMSNSPVTGTLGSVVLSISPTLVTPTLGDASATTLSVGGAPPTCAAGSAGAYCSNEGTAVTGASGVDDIYGDSTAHCMTVINQLANMGCIVGSLRSTMVADWTCGTAGTVASCVSATIIGSGGGTPLTLTLPLAAISYDWDCDLVVGQATGATANNWNMLTATNGATNVTVSYTQGDSATTFGGGATTDQAATTTTFNIGGTWTLGGTGTKMPVHIHGRIEGASASGTVVSLQLVAPTVGDLVTIYRGASCWAH